MLAGRKRPRVSSATGTWTPRKKVRTLSRPTLSTGIRTGGWGGTPGRRGELKYVDAANDVTFAVAGTLILLNGIAPGTGASQRIGKKVTMKSLQFRAAINSGDTGAVPFRGMVRLLWIYDKQANATAPTSAQILESAQAASPMNMDNRDRFVVLTDKQYAVDQSGGHQSVQMKFFKKMNLQTVFNAGATGAIGDITTGSVYLIILADNGGPTASTNLPVISYYNRIRYEDA